MNRIDRTFPQTHTHSNLEPIREIRKKLQEVIDNNKGNDLIRALMYISEDITLSDIDALNFDNFDVFELVAIHDAIAHKNKKRVLYFVIVGFLHHYQHANLILKDILSLELNHECLHTLYAKAYIIKGDYQKVEHHLKEIENPATIAYCRSILALKSKKWATLATYIGLILSVAIKNKIKGLEAFEKGEYVIAKKYFELLEFKDSEVTFYYWKTLKLINEEKEAANFLNSLSSDHKNSLLDNASLQYKPTIFESYKAFEIDIISDSYQDDDNLFKYFWFYICSNQIDIARADVRLRHHKYRFFSDFVHNLSHKKLFKARSALKEHVKMYNRDEMAMAFLATQLPVANQEEQLLGEEIVRLTKAKNTYALELLSHLPAYTVMSGYISYYVTAVFSAPHPPVKLDFTGKKHPYFSLMFPFKSFSGNLRKLLLDFSPYIEELVKVDTYNPHTQQLYANLLIEKKEYQKAVSYCNRCCIIWELLNVRHSYCMVMMRKIEALLFQSKFKEGLEICNQLYVLKYNDYEFYIIYIELLFSDLNSNKKLIQSLIDQYLDEISFVTELCDLFFLLKKYNFNDSLAILFEKILSSPDLNKTHVDSLEDNSLEAYQILKIHKAALKNGGNEKLIRYSRILNLAGCFSNPKTILEDSTLYSSDLIISLVLGYIIDKNYEKAKKLLDNVTDFRAWALFSKIYLHIKSKEWAAAENQLKLYEVSRGAHIHLRGLLAFEKGDYLTAKQVLATASYKNNEVKLLYFKSLVFLNEIDKAKEFYDSLAAEVKLTHTELKSEYDELVKKTSKPLRIIANPVGGFVEKEEKKDKVKEFDPSKFIGALPYPYDPKFQNEGGPDPLAELTLKMRKAKKDALELIAMDNQEEVIEEKKPLVKTRPVLSNKIELVPAKAKAAPEPNVLLLPEGAAIINPSTKVTTEIYLFSGPYALRISEAIKSLNELFGLEKLPMNALVYLCIKTFELIHPARVMTNDEEKGVLLLNQYGIKTENLKSIRNLFIHYSYLLDETLMLQFCKKLKATNLLESLKEALTLTQVPNSPFQCDLTDLKPVNTKPCDNWELEVKLSNWQAEIEKNLKLITRHFQKGFEKVKREHLLSKEDLIHLWAIKVSIINIRTHICHIKEVDRSAGLKLEERYPEFIKFGNDYAHVQFSLEDITLELVLSFAQKASKY